MATPDYSFVYPNSDHRFFVVYNTNYDLPETIPMDLATFIAYHFARSRQISGLLSCYHDLVSSGCTLVNTTFEDLVSDVERNFQYDIIKYCGLIKIAEEHRDASAELHELLLQKRAGNYELKLALERHSIQIRPSNYYTSICQTIDWEYRTGKIDDLSPNIVSEIQRKFQTQPLEIDYSYLNSLLSFPHEMYLHFIEQYGMPLHLVPHLYRFNEYYRNICAESEASYLLPDFTFWKTKDNDFHLLHRIGADKFFLVCAELTVELARIYLMQVCEEFEEISARFKESGGDAEALDLTQIEDLLTIKGEGGLVERSFLPEVSYDPNYNKEMISVYYFMPPDKTESSFPRIYTGLTEVSFDQGGLAKMIIYNDYYVLCNANGQELTPLCQDLELGINGFLIMRSPPGWWEYCQYTQQGGMESLSDKFQNIRPQFKISVELRDQLPFMYEAFMQDRELSFHQGKGNKTLLKECLDKKELIWPSAPALLPYYYNDSDLAKAAIRNNYMIYTLLPMSLIKDPQIFQTFAETAPYEFYAVAEEVFDLSREVYTDPGLCGRWLQESFYVYLRMPQEMCRRLDFLLIIAQKHLSHFDEVAEELRDDERIMLACMEVEPEVFRFATGRLKDKETFVQTALSLDPKLIHYASGRLRDSPGIFPE